MPLSRLQLQGNSIVHIHVRAFVQKLQKLAAAHLANLARLLLGDLSSSLVQ